MYLKTDSPVCTCDGTTTPNIVVNVYPRTDLNI